MNHENHEITGRKLSMGMYFAGCTCGHTYSSSSDWDLIEKDHLWHVTKELAKIVLASPAGTQEARDAVRAWEAQAARYAHTTGQNVTEVEINSLGE